MHAWDQPCGPSQTSRGWILTTTSWCWQWGDFYFPILQGKLRHKEVRQGQEMSQVFWCSLSSLSSMWPSSSVPTPHKTWGRVAWTPGVYFSQCCRLDVQQAQHRVRAPSSCCTQLHSCCVSVQTGGEREESSSLVSIFRRALIPPWGFSPRDLI